MSRCPEYVQNMSRIYERWTDKMSGRVYLGITNQHTYVWPFTIRRGDRLRQLEQHCTSFCFMLRDQMLAGRCRVARVSLVFVWL